MKKHLSKRILALLLTLAMVLSMIPVAAAEDTAQDTYALATELKDGDKVVIVNPDVNKAVSNADLSTQYPQYRAGVDVTPVDGKLTAPDAAIVWTVETTEQGVLLKDADGRKLSMDSKGLELDKANDVWEIRPLEAGTVALVNVNAKAGNSGDPKALEWYKKYSEFSTHYLNTSDPQFIHQLYVLETAGGEEPELSDDLVILFTNDVHCGVDQNDSSIGIAGLAKVKKELEATHKNVALVDNGDAIQGELIGTVSKGEYLVQLMNFVGYDYGTFGNHEYDYTMPQLKKLVDMAEMTYLSCNFQYIGEGEDPNAVDVSGYAVVDYDGLKVGYVGITTPESLVKSTPTYFQDENGQWIYTFCNDETGAKLYEAVQTAVDAARADGAQVVVALAHLGIDEQSEPWRSTDVIANTTGIDVVLDGHSHSTIERQEVANKNGETVLLSSTGTKLAHVGKLTITPQGAVNTELIKRSDVDGVDPETQAYLEQIEAEFEDLKQQVVAHVDSDLLTRDPETGARMVRMRETNLGDVCADAYRTVLEADVAFVNGGGVRADIPAGDVTYEQIINVHPYSNMACKVKTTGQQILDALEMASRNVTMNEDGTLSNENGGFLQVSGLKYTINTAIPSSVVVDDTKMFVEVAGQRRVQDVEILQADGTYAPIDPEGTYTLASHNYMLKQSGDGINMFKDDELLLDEVKVDNQVLIEYMTSEEFKAHDYSDWKGEGRITVKAGDAGARIKVFETTDIHGYLMDTSSGVEDSFQYRLAYIAQIVNNARADAAYDDVLLLDGGDTYQGTPVSNLLEGEALRAAMDTMDYDAFALGNHEFDWGVTNNADENATVPAYDFGPYVGNPDTPIVCYNLYDAETGESVGFTKDYVVVKKAGYKIAIVGYIPDYSLDIMAAEINPYTIDPDLSKLDAKVKEINAEEKPDVTVVLAHESPKRIANAMDPKEVQLVVGGHSHSGTAGTADNGVAYIQGNCQGQGYASALIDIQGAPGAVTSVTIDEPLYTGITGKDNRDNLLDTPENADKLDPTVLAISHLAWEAVKESMEEDLGYIDTAVTKKGKLSDNGATAAGNWITGLMLDYMKDKGVVAAFYNSGGIRTSFEIPEGETTRRITAGDIYTINPFCNYWLVYELNGAELAQQLINGMENGNYGDQMSGLTFTYWQEGSGKNVVRGIVSITLADGTVVDPTDTENIYRVCTSNYSGTLAGGVFETKEPVFPSTEAPIDNETIIEILRAAKAGGDGYISVDTTGRGTKVEKPAGDLAGKTIILHTNDTHGALLGFAQVAQVKKDLEARGADVILVDAGDFSQGTTYVSTNKGAAAVTMLNAAGYDFVTLGNHEFDFGYAQLMENLEKREFIALCADVFTAESATILPGEAVYEKDGLKIGFFGMETPETQTKVNPGLIQGLEFATNENGKFKASAELAVHNLKEIDGADLIIGLVHLGVDPESEPYRSIDLYNQVEGIDFLIDGHSHTAMTPGEAQSQAGVDKNGAPVYDTNPCPELPIQSTGTKASDEALMNVGYIQIDNATKTIEETKLIPLGEEAAKDPVVAAKAQEIMDAVDAEYGAVFARSEVELNGDRAPGNRNQETNLGDLITDAMIWGVLKDMDAETLGVSANNVVAVTNGGGIRAWIHAGDVTMNDVNTVLPFGNTVAVVYVKGSELLEALEASTHCTPTAVGGFPQVSGIQYNIDTTKEFDEGALYPESTYHQPNSIRRVSIESVNGKKFKPDATYAVVTNNFCAAGGDTYYAFKAASKQFDTGMPMDVVLMNYIKEELGGVIGQEYAAPQGRITQEFRFDDVKDATKYFFGPVYWAFNHVPQITKGTDDTHFSPDNTCTRGDVVTFLWRAMGQPQAENTTTPFTDVKKGKYYYNAVLWAVENGITSGTGDGKFEPGKACNRGDVVTFLWRAMGKPEAVNTESPFTDAVKGKYYFKAMLWAVENEITKGTSPTTFSPDKDCTRGDVVTFLFRTFSPLEPDGRIECVFPSTSNQDIAKYGNIYTDLDAAAFFADGFTWGDVVTVKFLDKELDLPVVPVFNCVDQGTGGIFVTRNAETGKPEGRVLLAINMGNFAEFYDLATKTTNPDKSYFWTAKEGVEFPVPVTLELKEAGGYAEELAIRDLNRTNNRGDYPDLTDAEFGNFRRITTTGMGNRLFRGSSPINPEIGRNTYVDAELQKAGVTVVMNLADSEAAAQKYPGFADSYYSKQNVVYLNLGVDFQAADFQAGLATGLRHFAENEGVYYVHCTEGKDRAGFVSALLECFMGATYDEVVADYLKTYTNYYNVVAGKQEPLTQEALEALANANIVKSLQAAFGVEDLKTADLAAEAEEYIKAIGLTDAEVAALRKNLGYVKVETTFPSATKADMDKYGDVHFSISSADLAAAGFQYKDLVKLTFLDQELIVPIIPQYRYVGAKAVGLVMWEDGTKPAEVEVFNGSFAATYGLADVVRDGSDYTVTPREGVEFPVPVTIELYEKQGYADTYMIFDLNRSNNREDYRGETAPYPNLTDEEFANFRVIATTGMGEGKLYRSSSPINPSIGRNTYADKAAEAAGVKSFVNLADSAAAAAKYAGYAETYYSNQNIAFLNLGVDFTTELNREGLVSAMNFIADENSQAPFLVHCNEGQDRAGFVSALLECLMGATYDEVVADYMVTFYNYYGVQKDTDQYKQISNNIVKNLSTAFGLEMADLASADLAAEAEAYLKELGVSDEVIAAVKEKLGAPQGPVNTEFEFLVTSDLHGQIYATDYTQPYEKSGTYSRGLTRVASYIKQQKTDFGDNLYVVDMGDTFQGAPLTYYYAFNKPEAKDPAILAFRSIGYDMWVVGNHEFNYGLQILTRQMDYAVSAGDENEKQLTISMANYLKAETNSDESKDWSTWRDVAPYVIKDFDGYKVAIIGFGNPNIPQWDVPANWEGIYFAPIVETYKHYEAEMLEKADMIVVVAHSGTDSDPNSDFIKQLVEETDTIAFAFSGHEHKNTITTVNNKSGKEIPILSPYTKARRIAQVKVTVENGEATVVAPELKNMENYPIDEALAELLKPYEVDTWENYMLQEIGKALGDYPAANLGTAPSAFVDLINTVQTWGGYDRTGLNTPDDTSDDTPAMLSITAPLTSGSNANLIPQGPIYLGDMFGLYRFENWFYQITMTGEEVHQWLEYAATKIRVDDDGNPYVTNSDLTYYDIITGDGFRYDIDVSKPEGERVVNITYNGEKVAADQVFTVMVNNYRYNGGGNYVSWLNNHGCSFEPNDPDRIIYSTQFDMIQGEDEGQARALLVSYIKEQTAQNGGIEPTITSTWTVRNGEEAPAYYLVGDMNGWKPDEAYRLTASTEHEGEWVLTLDLPGQINVKVMTPEPEEWFPGGEDNNKWIENAGTYHISFYPEGGKGGYYHWGYFRVYKDPAYYLVGDMTGWAAAEGWQLTASQENPDEWVGTFEIPERTNVKIKDEANNEWYPGGSDNDRWVEAGGAYDVSFYPEGGQGDDYHEGFFKLTASETGHKYEVVQSSSNSTRFGHIDINVPVADFLETFALGDVVTVEVNGFTFEAPVVTNYDDVDTGEYLLRCANGKQVVTLAINYGQLGVVSGMLQKNTDPETGNVSYSFVEGLEWPVYATVELKEAGGYADELAIRKLNRTNNRSDYADLTDAEFANFRAVATNGMGENVLYRSSSPIDPDLGRNTYADAAAQAAGIKTFINLADTQAIAEAFEGYTDSYYSTQTKIFLGLPVAFTSDEFKAGLAEGFRFITTNEGPYLIHCLEGKDRTGLSIGILECLMGASLEEVQADYLKTYENYFEVKDGAHVALTDEQEKVLTGIITKNLGIIFDADLETADLAAEAEAYLTEIGLTAQEIATLKSNLNGTPEPEEGYVLSTGLPEDGKQYVIVAKAQDGKYYALDNVETNKAVTTSTLLEVDEASMTFAEAPETVLYTAAVDGESIQFMVGENYLHLNASKIRVTNGTTNSYLTFTAVEGTENAYNVRAENDSILTFDGTTFNASNKGSGTVAAIYLFTLAG